jgi:hypothetical protein
MHEFNENDLIDSPLNQNYEEAGKSVEILIYRLPGTRWTAEVVDQYGNSTVWNDEFETDVKALECVLHDLREEGIDEFIGKPSAS